MAEADRSLAELTQDLIDYAADVQGAGDDPVVAVRSWLGDLSADGALELVTGNEVALIRDDRVVALITTQTAPGGGGLLVQGYEACADVTMP